jgi:hypothetical protein
MTDGTGKSIMYKIIGGDLKQYGPVSAADVGKWIDEGRLNAQSLVQAYGDIEWKQLSQFPEFAEALAGKPATPGTPQPFSSPATAADGGRDTALKLVKGPAIALIITAGLGVAYYALSGLLTLFTGGAMFHQQLPPNIPPQMQAFLEGMQGPLAGVMNLVIAAWNGFVLFGALKMLRLQNHGVAVVASVAAMLPCQCCCLLGLPFGIWALVVLNKPEVKSQFT